MADVEFTAKNLNRQAHQVFENIIRTIEKDEMEFILNKIIPWITERSEKGYFNAKYSFVLEKSAYNFPFSAVKFKGFSDYFLRNCQYGVNLTYIKNYLEARGFKVVCEQEPNFNNLFTFEISWADKDLLN